MIRRMMLSIVAGVALGLTLTVGARSTSADFCTDSGCKSTHINQGELPPMLKTMFVPQYLLIDNHGRVAGRWLGLNHSDPQGIKALDVSDILKPSKQL